MKKLLVFLLSILTIQSNAQDIEFINPKEGFKEIDLTNPTFSVKPDPIPKANEIFKTTHLMISVCSHDGDGSVIHQYINQTNGVIGTPKELLKKWHVMDALPFDSKELDYWAILPNKTQIYYTNTADNGKIAVEMTTGDGNYTNTMARFDNMMEGEIFWLNAKKTQSIKIPKGQLSTSQKFASEAFMADVYEFPSEEGKMRAIIRDLGEAKGQYAPLKSNYAVVGLSGLGWVYNKRNNHVYLVYDIQNIATKVGCRLAGLIPEKHTFSGAGYKPMGDILMSGIAKSHQENLSEIDQTLQENLENETDLQLIALYKEKAKAERELQTNNMETNTNGAMLNDASEISRGMMEMALNPDIKFKTMDINLRIEARKLEIELSDNQDPEQRKWLNKKLNCNRQQQTLWMNYRTDGRKLQESIKGMNVEVRMEKLGTLLSAYQQRILQACSNN